MVDLYIMNISGLPDPAEHREIMDGLWEERKQKILRYQRAENRRQSLGAGRLLQHALQRRGLEAAELRYGPNGKPEAAGMHFNLSHSDEWVACAVSDQPVGCDLEKIGPVHEGIAKRFFTENEVRYLECFDGQAKLDEFFRLWTMKESYMKMTGEGLSLGLNHCEFVLEDPVQVYRDGQRCDCWVREYALPGYKLTVCAQEQDFAAAVRQISVEEVWKG